MIKVLKHQEEFDYNQIFLFAMFLEIAETRKMWVPNYDVQNVICQAFLFARFTDVCIRIVKIPLFCFEEKANIDFLQYYITVTYI